MIRTVALAVLFVASGTLDLAAQGELDGDPRTPVSPGERPDTSDVYLGARGDIAVKTPTFANPDIRIDGRIQEAAWDGAARLGEFTQYDPTEGVPASERTEALVFVSEDAVYIAVRAFDSEPGGIRASLAERDNVVRRDDYVRVTLDTFRDGRRAFVFVVNPLGVQQDGIWFEGRQSRFGPPVDYNPDLIWESEGRVEDWGWTVEIRIPFKSLRFPGVPVQSWGFQVMRRLERMGYESSWAPISRDQVNQLGQAGSIDGLRDLDPGLFLEFNPVMTASVAGVLDDADQFSRASGAEFGGNLTYGLTSNLTLDGTVNPDFSQVEADAGQIAVNERFALFFPEKRPFFLSGTEIFGLPKQLIYTRSVVNPIVGSKVTGKVGETSLGYLGAVDQVGDDQAYVNLLRLRRDLGTGSNVGLVYTDRSSASDRYNRVAGADARIVLGRRYTVTMLGAVAATADPGSDRDVDGMFSARLERTGRGLSFHAELEDVGSRFSAQSGFIRRRDVALLTSRVGWNWYGASGSLVERIGYSLEANGVWDHQGFWEGRSWEENKVELGTTISMRGNTTLFLTAMREGFDTPLSEYGGLFTSEPSGDAREYSPSQSMFLGMNGFRAFLFLSNWERLRGRISSEWKETPIFQRSLGVPVERADSWNMDVNLTVYPSSASFVEGGLRHVTLTRQRDGTRYSTATIPRVRAQYQITRSLFVRGVAEYETEDIAALTGSGGESILYCADGDGCVASAASSGHDVYLEGLVSYEPSPGTVVFLGYSRQMEGLSRFRFQGVSTQADGFFAKLSYRFRY